MNEKKFEREREIKKNERETEREREGVGNERGKEREKLSEREKIHLPFPSVGRCLAEW